MKSSHFFGSLFVILYVHRVIGLECYSCIYVEGIPDEFIDTFGEWDSDKSCRSGSVPNKKFVETCDDGFGSFNVSCEKFQFTVKSSFDVSGEMELVILRRGCLQTIMELEDVCFLDQSPEQLVNNSNLADEIRNEIADSIANSQISFCSCNTDKCNSSSGLKVDHGFFIFSLAYLFQFLLWLV